VSHVPREPEVFINGRFLGQRVTGVQRYARETLHALDELLAADKGAGLRWTLLVPRGTPLPVFRHVMVETLGRLQGHLWEQLELPWRARAGLLFCFGLTGPLLKHQQIITVHDAAVVRMPENFKATFRHGYRWLVRSIARRAPRTMAVSQFGAAEAIEMGLASHAVPQGQLKPALEGLVTQLLAKPPEALRQTQKLLRKEDTNEILQRMELENGHFGERLQSDEVKQAITAFFAARMKSPAD